jgi:CubicO group peptidase (beta-lactamase class C family)
VRRANLPAGGSLAERVKRAASLPLNFQPGSQWEYSPSTGFDTLGRIVEIVSGVTLNQFFKTRIFDPLGMKDTFFTVPANRAADVPVAYTKNEDRLSRPSAPAARAESSGPYFSGAGGLTGSAGDHLSFSQMLLNGGQLNGVRLLGRKTVELMTADATGPLDLRNYAGDQVLKGYGFGLGVRVRRSTGDNGWMGSVGDYGWAGALGTYFWIDPKEQLIGIVMIQTRNTRLRMEYPNLVYQAISD